MSSSTKKRLKPAEGAEETRSESINLPGRRRGCLVAGRGSEEKPATTSEAQTTGGTNGTGDPREGPGPLEVGQHLREELFLSVVLRDLKKEPVAR